MKINLQKAIINILVFTLIISVCSTFAFAASDSDSDDGDSDTTTGSIGSDSDKIGNPIPGADSLSDFFDSVVSVAIQLGTIISVLGIMYGGFQYVSAQGDEEKLGKARNTITWALVGTAVLLGARTIMAVVKDTVEQLG